MKQSVDGAANHGSASKWKWFVASAILGTMVFSGSLRELLKYSLDHELHSHIPLIPVVSVYLIYLRRESLRLSWKGSWRLALVMIITSLISFLWLLVKRDAIGDYYHFGIALSYLVLGYGIAFGFLGWETLRQMAFPLAFLIFIVPLPEFAVEKLENVLVIASAVVTEWFFGVLGTPVMRSGQTIELPVIVLEVARECSGIRSTWVLFITSTLASYLFLESSWRRLFLILLVLPLGILRNALRITVIGQLCVWFGPEMIESWIHRSGGPVFFGVSLISLLVILTFLRWSELRKALSYKDGHENSAQDEKI